MLGGRTVRYEGRWLQMPPSEVGGCRSSVEVLQLVDGQQTQEKPADTPWWSGQVRKMDAVCWRWLLQMCKCECSDSDSDARQLQASLFPHLTV
jgi:hypothetical protein